jgi:arginine-tRNA-protein transferase
MQFKATTNEKSEIRLHGYYSKDHCGYCKQGNSSSYGATSDKLYADDYETLMLIGWRRSGTFLYKPTMYKVI